MRSLKLLDGSKGEILYANDKTGTETTEIRVQKTKCEKTTETGFLVATWLALGLYLEIFGPTLIDLKIKLNTDYEKVAVAVSGRSFGLFPGCVIGGFFVDKFGKYCHLMLGVCLDVAAIVTVFVPWSPNVELLWFLCFVGGFVESVINIAGQRCILKLWQEKATAPMILLHSGYGFGSFLIPLYTNPFLAMKREDIGNSTLTETNTTSSAVSNIMQNSTISEYIRESKIEYTYAISASIVAIHSISFYIYQIRERKYQDLCNSDEDVERIDKTCKTSEDRTFIELINPATCTGGHIWYGIQVFALLFFLFANVNGGERVQGGFIRSFSIDQLNFSISDASYVNTAFWISFAVGRISFSVAANWISVRVLILIETGGVAAVTVFMTIFARSSSIAYWVLIPFLGIFHAPLWPTFVAWADYHLELTGMGMMLILLGGSVGGIGHLRLVGYLYEHIGSYTFVYQLLGYALFALVLAILLDVVGAQHGSRFSWNKQKNEEKRVEMVYIDKDSADYHETSNDDSNSEM